MSENERDLTQTEDDGRPAGARRYRPAVAFGLRAAALAGLAVTVGVGEAAAMSSVFDDPAMFGPGSTCCITVE